MTKLGMLQAPSLRALAGEGLGFLIVPSLIAAIPGFSALPRGRNAPVMVLPGVRAGDNSTFVIRGLLSALGYAVSGWGFGINRGEVDEMLPKVLSAIRSAIKVPPQGVTVFMASAATVLEFAICSTGIRRI